VRSEFARLGERHVREIRSAAPIMQTVLGILLMGSTPTSLSNQRDRRQTAIPSIQFLTFQASEFSSIYFFPCVIEKRPHTPRGSIALFTSVTATLYHFPITSLSRARMASR
jgi:hypothetical protein